MGQLAERFGRAGKKGEVGERFAMARWKEAGFEVTDLTQEISFQKAGIDFDVSLAYNAHSSLIPYARKGGVTRDVITPHGGDSIFSGLASVVDLSGDLQGDIQKQARDLANSLFMFVLVLDNFMIVSK